MSTFDAMQRQAVEMCERDDWHRIPFGQKRCGCGMYTLGWKARELEEWARFQAIAFYGDRNDSSSERAGWLK
jgi:hypothetical protein